MHLGVSDYISPQALLNEIILKYSNHLKFWNGKLRHIMQNWSYDHMHPITIFKQIYITWVANFPRGNVMNVYVITLPVNILNTPTIYYYCFYHSLEKKGENCQNYDTALIEVWELCSKINYNFNHLQSRHPI